MSVDVTDNVIDDDYGDTDVSEDYDITPYRRHTSRQNEARQLSCIVHNTEESDYIEFVAFVIQGCSQGFKCVRIRRSTSQVVEYEEGRLTEIGAQACQPSSFVAGAGNSASSAAAVVTSTLVSAGRPLEPRPCPYPGTRYSVSSRGGGGRSNVRCSDSTTQASTVMSGCNRDHSIQMEHHCTRTLIQEHHHCHGEWHSGDYRFLIIRNPETDTIQCMSFTDRRGGDRGAESRGEMRVVSSAHTCVYPDQPPRRREHHQQHQDEEWTWTLIGVCPYASGTSSSSSIHTSWCLLISLMLMCHIRQLLPLPGINR